MALDTAPLHGHRTGVAVATAGFLSGLDRRDDVTVQPFLVSFRATPEPPERRLPLPAGVAARLWARTDLPRVDRWLGAVDVVHGTNYVAPPSRRPTVISVYDCWFLAHPKESTPAVRRAAGVLRRAVRRGARVHVSSAATARLAADLLDTDRISVVHLGPPANDDPPGDEASTPRPPSPAPSLAGSLARSLDGRPFLLAIGTIERRKDLPSLVRAFGRLAPQFPDLHLVLAGAAGDDHDRVTDEIERLSADDHDRIHVPGPVDAATKAWLLRSAATLVYPSLDEGFGFPVLEAQRAGTPVVARRAGSIPEVAGDGAELVDPGSVDDLADGIRHVLDDPEHRDHLVRAGHRNLDRFSWDRCAAEMTSVYRLAMEESA